MERMLVNSITVGWSFEGVVELCEKFWSDPAFRVDARSEVETLEFR